MWKLQEQFISLQNQIKVWIISKTMRIWNKYYLKKQESNELSIQEYTAYQLKISKELDDKKGYLFKTRYRILD